MIRPWTHSDPTCDEHTCYCVDEIGDPMCECGQPAFACRCEEIRAAEGWPEEDES